LEKIVRNPQEGFFCLTVYVFNDDKTVYLHAAAMWGWVIF